MNFNYMSHWRVFEETTESKRQAAVELGFVAQLLKRLPRHRDRPFRHLETVIEPAMRQHRFKLFFNEDGTVVGMVIWAHLMPEVSDRVRSMNRFELHDSEWTEGDEWWIVELACLAGHAKYMARALRAALPPECRILNYLRQRRAGTQTVALRLDNRRNVGDVLTVRAVA
ncbi:hemolysin-activating ACP:hemolysin acyltransferase [Pelomonas aquatica]|uniref:RTX toxin-activating lysine-acyltransferase n=1 Tax=Pelomonas aquatica TaxID=431058 RepID=A0ABU1ZFT2_9BURK|nr:toxin-activating lysine-acyltransferase [Pelomonas aquatica]MDR7299495.1 hemolysin-activating ACP:hemolysin acyltransferase [Pelomonas aquatica]